ncbi:hypothetical protein AEGHOMDF_3544 [Methylobacterium soli]|nr:hypothetical protein AEGHOMDF_3544 [Methylobacterium soli]
MQFAEIVQSFIPALPRDPLPNEAVLAVHVSDEPALSKLLRDSDDVEVVDRDLSCIPNSTLVCIRCEDELEAWGVEAVWASYRLRRQRVL